MKPIRFTAAAMLALSAAACATPTTVGPSVTSAAVADETQRQVAYVFKARMAEQERVARVAARLMAANVDVCPAKAWRAGLHVSALGRLDARLRPGAQEALGVADAAQLIYVEPGSPAEAADLHAGDVLLQVKGTLIPVGPKAQSLARQMLTKASKTHEPFTVEVSHEGTARFVELHPREVCDYPARVADSDEVNAHADGREIFISRGMLKLAGSDEELAVVIAHEMAHDTEGHIAAKQRNAAAGMVGGAALDILAAAAGVNTQGAFTRAAGQAGAGYASPAFEAEADYVGLYYMARAGYDIGHAEDFWRKMAVGYLDAMDAGPKNAHTNWQSHRIKLATMAAYQTGDAELTYSR